MTKIQEALDSHIESIKEETEALKIEQDWLAAGGRDPKRIIQINKRLEHLDYLLELLTDR